MTKETIEEADIDAEIVGEMYHVFPETTLTVCALTLKNGFTVIGDSAALDLDRFDPEIGCRVAKAKAREKLWPLLAFRVRDRADGWDRDRDRRREGLRRALAHEALAAQTFKESSDRADWWAKVSLCAVIINVVSAALFLYSYFTI